MNKIKVGDVWWSITSSEKVTVNSVGNFYALCSSSDTSREDEYTMPLDACLFNSGIYGRLIERDGKPVEPEKLEDKIKEEYSGYEVVMLKRREGSGDLVINIAGLPLHVLAQSMKGFRGYVYNFDQGFKTENVPLGPSVYITPVAVLFSKAEE